MRLVGVACIDFYKLSCYSRNILCYNVWWNLNFTYLTLWFPQSNNRKQLRDNWEILYIIISYYSGHGKESNHYARWRIVKETTQFTIKTNTGIHWIGKFFSSLEWCIAKKSKEIILFFFSNFYFVKKLKQICWMMKLNH